MSCSEMAPPVGKKTANGLRNNYGFEEKRYRSSGARLIGTTGPSDADGRGVTCRCSRQTHYRRLPSRMFATSAPVLNFPGIASIRA
jgi:hypothetical protein